MSDPLAQFENVDVEIVEAGGGYDMVIDTDDDRPPLVVHEEPIDPLWEQLVERGVIEP